MLKTIIYGKYDVQSFSYDDSLKIVLTSDHMKKILNFGDRIVYTKFYEEELANKNNFIYYELLKEKLCNITMILDTESQLIKKIENDTGFFYSSKELKHYIIIAENYIMEIVTFNDVEETQVL